MLVEDFALLTEEMGRTRMDGRVMAWLLLADPPVQSLTQIVQGLGVSKAAVSTAARSVLRSGLVERVSEPERRGDFYRALPFELSAILRLDHLERLRRFADHGLALVTDRDQTKANRAMLLEMRDFVDFLQAEIPGLIARWQTHRAVSRGATSSGAGVPQAADGGGTP